MKSKLKGFILGSLLACISGLSFAQQAIMPVGNSITGGQDRPSYRLPLLDELAAVNCSVDMVGDQTLNSFDYRDPINAPGSHSGGFSPDLGYDTDHQAFPGIRTEQLVSGVPTPPGTDQFPVSPLSAYVSAEQPDFVLLHTGTNDLNVAVSQGLQTTQELDTWANQTIGEVDTMIDQIFLSHNNPADLRVLLANFIPYQGPFSDQAQIDAAIEASAIFTQKLEELVATKGNPRLLIVDVATGFDLATMTVDGVHPNDIGEQHIAGAFLPVLFGAGLCAATNNVPFITAPANGDTVNGDPLTITWDDNGFVADSWQVYVGDTQSGNSSTYFDSGVLGTSVRSVTVPTLPKDGSNVFISLNYSSGGILNQIITRFVSDPAGITSPTITSPVPDSVLPGSDVTFNWADNGTAVTQWYFRIGSTFGGDDYVDTRITNGAQRSAAFSGLPTDGSRVFVEFSHRTPAGVWVSSNLEYDAADDTPVNEPPVAVDDALGPVDVGQTLNLDVLANDTDSDGTLDISSVTITVGPTEGSATVLATGEIEYIHDGNTTTGTDTLSYTVRDDLGAVSNEAVVTITVNEPVNEAPVANDDTDGPLDAGASVTVDVLANDTDSDGTVDPATVAIASQPAAGTLVIEDDGQITYTHDGTAGTGSDSFTYTVLDDDGAISNAATVTITPVVDPDPENEAPVANDDTDGPLDAGASVTVDILANDTDSDGTVDPATVAIASQPAAGTLVIESDGQITYTHDGTADTGSDSFTYTVQDDDGATSNAATVTITPINDPVVENVAPVANDDTDGPLDAGASITVDVLANDTDSDGTIVPATVAIASQPAAGTLFIESDGQITYTHDGSAGTGSDSFTYTVQDDDGATSNAATVTITPINDPVVENVAPVANDDTDGPLVAGASITVDILANDTDSDGTIVPATVAIASQPAAGTLVIETDGQITYTHDGSAGTGSDSFTYTVQDDDGATSNAATVTITPINDPVVENVAPVANDDTDGPLVAGASITVDILANDTDSDGTIDPATVVIASQPAAGTLVIESDGQITYTHDGTAGTGSDSFTYTVQDDDGATSNAATVTITPINDPVVENVAPVANDDTDGPLDAGASITVDVLANDTDSDGTIDPATVAIASQPAAGTLVIETDGQITYTHDGSAGTGSDSFSYTVQDDDGATSNAATVTITPITTPGPTVTDPVQGTQLTGTDVTFSWDDNGVSVAQWFLRVGLSEGSTEFAEMRFRDPTVTELQVTGLPTDGVPVFVEFSYFKDNAWTTQNFEYQAFESNGVNQAPVADDDTAGPLDAGDSITVNVLANDSDADGTLDPSTVTVMMQPASGTVAVQGDGQIIYTHDGFAGTGSDTFTYTVQDNNGEPSNIATVTITPINDPVVENEAPVANDDSNGPLDAGASITVDVLANDTDSDGTIAPATVTIAAQPAAGSVVVESDGQITYTHDGSAGTGSDSFSYTVQDDEGALSNIATVTITPIIDPDPENVAPVANDDADGPLDAGASITVDVLANDTDSDGTVDPATVAIASQPAAGTLVIESDGQITYTHNGTAGTGSDSFSYTVRDDDGAISNAATVTISPINDPVVENQAPVAANDSAGPIEEGESITVNVLANDTDADGNIDPATVAIASQPSAGTLVIESDGQITYAHDGTAGTGSDSFTYTVRDNEGAISNAATVTISPITSPGPLLPTVTDPLPGTQLTGSDVTFSWDDNGVSVAQWFLRVGLSEGSTEFAEMRFRDPTVTELQVTGLPTNGVPVFIEFSYFRDNAWTTQNFEYQAFESNGVNQAPVADDDTAGPLDAGDSITVNVLANDTDADGTLIPSTVTVMMQPASGTVAVQTNGQITYTHDGSAGTGSDTFTYTLEDNNGEPSNIATVTITPIIDPDPENEAPVANDDSNGPLDAGASITVDVLANDTDSDGTIAPATVVITSQPSAGTLAIAANGEITYTHNGAAGTGSDSFSYTVRDDDGALSNAATVTISPINDPVVENQAPVAANDSAGPIQEGDSITVNVLANDTDSDGTVDPATVAIASAPTAGTLVIESDGQITYTHDGSAGTGSDSFTYTVLDNEGAISNAATVTIAPITTSGTSLPLMVDPVPGTQLPGSTVTFMWDDNGNAVAQWYLRVGLSVGTTEFADVRFRNPAVTQFQVTGLPSNGVPVFVEFSFFQDGVWTVQNFEYQAFNDNGVNQAPVADDDTAGPLSAGASVTVNVLANDTDADGTLNPASVAIASQPSAGSVAVESDGQITYTHDGSVGTGSDSFSYTVQDDDGATSNAATVTISPINDPVVGNEAPVATDDTAGPIQEGESITVNVLANDTDSDGTVDSATVAIASQPSAGGVVVESDGQITYTHNGAAGTGSDSFSYTVQDDDGATSNAATVIITPINSAGIQPEIIDPLPGTQLDDTSVTFNWDANGIDVDRWYFRAGLSVGTEEFIGTPINNPAITQLLVTGLPNDGETIVHVEFSYFLNGSWNSRNFQYTAALVDTPPPPPPAELPPLVLSEVNWLHADVSGWEETATLTNVSINLATDRATLDYDKKNTWPAAQPLGGGVDLVANAWVFIYNEATEVWDGATWEWLRPGQTVKSASAVDGIHIKRPPYTATSGWEPVSGQTLYFMVSGLARNNTRNVLERSAPVQVIWP